MKKKVAKKFSVPKLRANEAPWEPDYQYECSRCGCIVSPPVALTKLDCPVYRKGHRCVGALIRFGKGTGRGSHFRKEVEA